MSTPIATWDRPNDFPAFRSGFCDRGTFWAVSGGQVWRRRPDALWESSNVHLSPSQLTPWNGGALAIERPEEGGLYATAVSTDGSIRRSRFALDRKKAGYQVSASDGFVHLRERRTPEVSWQPAEYLLTSAPDGEARFRPVYAPSESHSFHAFYDAEGEIAVLCLEGIYSPATDPSEAEWKVRFPRALSDELRAADGLVLHDRWFVGSSLLGYTVVLDLETLKLRRSALPVRRAEALLLWSTWLSAGAGAVRKLVDACWRYVELAPGLRSGSPDGGVAIRESADGRLEVLTFRGILVVPEAANEGWFDPTHPAAPILCAWELHLREPKAMRWAMETLLVADDSSELVPAMQARIGRRVGSRLLRFVRGRPTEGLLPGPRATGDVWQAEGRRLVARTLEAMEGADPARALLATRGAWSLTFSAKPGLFAWRSPGWGVAMRALAHADPFVRQEARTLAQRLGPWKALRTAVPEELQASAGFRDEMVRAVASADPLGSRLGRLLARASWEEASDARYSTTSLRHAPWDREASLFAGFVQALADDAPRKDASSALVRGIETLGLDGFHAAFDGLLLGLLLERSLRRDAPEAVTSGALAARLHPVLTALAAWERRETRQPRKPGRYPDRAARHEVALLTLALLLPGVAPTASDEVAEAGRSLARDGLSLGPAAEGALLGSPPREGLVARWVLREVAASEETKSRLCLAALLAFGDAPRLDLAARGGSLPLHLRLALAGSGRGALRQRAGEIAREPALLGLIALLALADRGDAEALAEALRRRGELLCAARFLEDDGAIDVLLGG